MANSTDSQEPSFAAHEPPSRPSEVGAWEMFRVRHRLLANCLVHSGLFALALLVAYFIRMDAGKPSERTWEWLENSFLPLLPYFVAAKLVIFGRAKLLRGGWQYSSIRDVKSVLLASWIFVAATLLLILLLVWLPEMFLLEIPGVTHFLRQRYSNGILVLDFLATVCIVCIARGYFRLKYEEHRQTNEEGLKKVLVVGAGNAAEAIVREILRMPKQKYRVMGLVDDDPGKQGILIHGVSVLGTTEDIRRLCEELQIDEIIIAIPSATGKQLRRVFQLCEGTKLKFQSLPGVGDLVEGRVMTSQIRPVDIHDLLGRESVKLDLEAVGRFLRGRRVLVTGAGGSIGSEMCRQICRFDPAALVLVEQAENPLFEIENELRASYPKADLRAVICDIADRARVRQVWAEHRPQVVIHAAAHKHVPLMERNPGEAVKNNIQGTKNVADASCEFGVDEFVTISTDKAVNPSSVMGATKRVAEMYTQALNGHNGCRTQFKAVRFGNVLGSSGSVVPTFRKQIAAGGPVTVTHPEMTRYFMTIPEASQLVLQAAATGQGGQIFLLDMGEPVKIVDLAEQMIRLSGFTPGEDIDIVFTGVRPGEKLFEELRTVGEDIAPTVHPKVLVWKRKPEDWDRVRRAVEDLGAIAGEGDQARIVKALRDLVPEYTPSPANGNGVAAGAGRP